ncbi:MAG: flagellar hook-basal body complex protein FliE [Sedimentisphaerales bacterium]|nr:flagellar hook-basal body complex protein FliE [Sedimentisphaerales bacterium]
MVEQYSSLQPTGLTRPEIAPAPSTTPAVTQDGKDFKSLLMDSIRQVNQLQEQADEARFQLATGQTDNVAEVFTAVKKAELAFQTLMQIRNKLMDAYEEIRQMRV